MRSEKEDISSGENAKYAGLAEVGGEQRNSPSALNVPEQVTVLCVLLQNLQSGFNRLPAL